VPVDGPSIESTLVPQVNMWCETRNDTFNCLQGEEIKNFNHSTDLTVECQDMDPTNPNRDDGV